MNRAKLAQLVGLVTTLVIGAAGWNIYLPNQGTVLADLADAGAATVTHVATCAVEVSPACQARYGVAHYEVVDFGIVRAPALDGGWDVLLPPLNDAVGCVQMVDFSICSLATAASKPTQAAKFGAANPFTLNAAARQCARKNTARGFGGCTRADGGDPGEMTVYRTSQLAGSCETIGTPVNADGVCFEFGRPQGQGAEDQ